MSQADNIKKELAAKFGDVEECSGSNGVEYKVICPKCKRNALSVNPEKLVFKCWHCEFKGRLPQLLKASNFIYIPGKVKPEKPFKFINPGNRFLPLSDAPEHCLRYLRERKSPTAEYLTKTFGFLYCESGKMFMQRMFDTTDSIIIPILDNKNKMIGWQSRLLYNPDELTEEECELNGWPLKISGRRKRPPKYMTMPGYKKSKMLWNINNAVSSDLVVVCEGVFDAVKVGRCGVAAFGKELSDEQLRIIKTNWKYVILLLDPAAENAAKRSQRKLLGSCYVELVDVTPFKDPGEADRTHIWKKIIEAFSEIDLSKIKITNV